MTDSKTIHLLMDTCYLREAGSNFQHPDFQKLLRFSREGKVTIFIPHIAWEERRTQIVDEAKTSLGKLHTSFSGVEKQRNNNVALKGLPRPMLDIWSDADIEGNSKSSMSAFAADNKITVIPIAPDHADRAWARYFDIKPPFNPDQPRENRRKDIPDSWILEAAIDVKNKHSKLMALCGDGKLSGALTDVGVKVYKSAQDVLDEVDRIQSSESIEQEKVQVTEVLDDDSDDEGTLLQALSDVQEEFIHLDAKVLGFITFLDGPTKGELFDLLEKSGVSIDTAKNIADRLSIAGVITDTGNHFLAKNNDINNLAAASVEPEIISLLGVD